MMNLNERLENKIEGKNNKYIELLDQYTFHVNELQKCKIKHDVHVYQRQHRLLSKDQ